MFEIVIFFWLVILSLLLFIHADKMDDLRSWVRDISDEVSKLEYSRMEKKEWERSKRNIETEIERIKSRLDK